MEERHTKRGRGQAIVPYGQDGAYDSPYAVEHDPDEPHHPHATHDVRGTSADVPLRCRLCGMLDTWLAIEQPCPKRKGGILGAHGRGEHE